MDRLPREGNGWSYHYCRRQWSLADDGTLRYQDLNNFEIAMVDMAKKNRLFTGKIRNLYTSNPEKLLAYRRGKLVFAFNFHPTESYQGFFLPVEETGDYEVVLSSDEARFGGYGRVDSATVYTAYRQKNGQIGFQIYLPSRAAVVLRKLSGK